MGKDSFFIEINEPHLLSLFTQPREIAPYRKLKKKKRNRKEGIIIEQVSPDCFVEK
jgi:hypothetical protein